MASTTSTSKPYPGVTTLTSTELQAAADALPGVRVIDPRLVSQAFVQLQQMRGFYTMPDVLDVDRYHIGTDELPQDVIVSARELNLNGLRGDQRNWNNDHTVYTHGYGVVAAYADKRGGQGQPVWAEQNLPRSGTLGHVQAADLLRGERAGLLHRRLARDHATCRAEHSAARWHGAGPELDVPREWWRRGGI